MEVEVVVGGDEVVWAGDVALLQGGVEPVISVHATPCQGIRKRVRGDVEGGRYLVHRGGFAAVDPVGGPVPGVRLRLPVATKAGGLLEAAGQAGAGAVEVTGAGTGAARRRRAGHGERDGAARCPAT